MNIVNSMYDRELGFGISHKYNIALGRLKCYDYDEFRGISPSTEGPDFNPEPPVFACNFCTTPGNEHLLALANEDGKIAIQDTNTPSDHNPFEGYQAHHNAIFDIAWVPGEMRLVSASGDHTAVLWDVLNSSQLQEVARFHAHTRSVKTVAFPQEEKRIFATGARDGVIMVWDTRIQKNTLQVRPDNSISYSHSAPGTPGSSSGGRGRKGKVAPSRANSITGLVFQDNYHLISCGAGDGKVKVWDLRKSYSTYRREPHPQHSLSAPIQSARNGFTTLALDPSRLKLYASCMDNTIYCFNVATYEDDPVAMFTGHINATFYVKACLSPDGQYLLSGSTDDHAYIWDTNPSHGKQGRPLVKLGGHGAEVTSVAWCPVGATRIVTCSDDARHCLWRVGLEHEGDNDQVELHGWAEECEKITNPVQTIAPEDRNSPVTPSTFQSLRRWAPCIQRTPDSGSESLPAGCFSCHRMATPCLRCIATRAPVPISQPTASKKRLEVLWEVEDSSVCSSSCPECQREALHGTSSTVSNNSDIPARRLFSPNRKCSPEDIGGKQSSVNISGIESDSPEKMSSPKRVTPEDSTPQSPQKRQKLDNFEIPAKSQLRSSPRKRPRAADTSISTPGKQQENVVESPRKKMRGDGNSSTFLIPEQGISPLKRLKLDVRSNTDLGYESQAGPSTSPRKRVDDTPTKRRVSERRTDSPHKRLPCTDDLQGISKMDDTLPSPRIGIKTSNLTSGLCARHHFAKLSSPTLNLPNYIVDGTSPHHSCSPAHRNKENVDWLTRLRKERNSVEKRTDTPSNATSARGGAASRTTPGRITPGRTTPGRVTPNRTTPGRVTPNRTTPGRVTPNRTTPGRVTPNRTTPGRSEKKAPKRRTSSTEASTSGPSCASRGSENLLKFFRVASKTCEQQCSTETPTNPNTASQPVNTSVV